MGKFKSINYTRVVCEDCGAETIIEPGRVFVGLNCNCNLEEARAYRDIKVFTDGTNYVEALGEFKNGDVEVKHTDGTLSYRMPKSTFLSQYNEIKKGITLDMLAGKTAQEIKDEYNMDELRTLAKAVKIRSAGQMKEDKLVGKLLEKV